MAGAHLARRITGLGAVVKPLSSGEQVGTMHERGPPPSPNAECFHVDPSFRPDRTDRARHRRHLRHRVCAGARPRRGRRDSGHQRPRRRRSSHARSPTLRGEGSRIEGARFDVTQEAEIGAEIARIEAEIGPIDILVNNAGIQRRGPLLEMDPATWDEVIRTNLTRRVPRRPDGGARHGCRAGAARSSTSARLRARSPARRSPPTSRPRARSSSSPAQCASSGRVRTSR